MAYYQIKFFSNALKRQTSFEMFMPNDFPDDRVLTEAYQRPMKALVLLHGYCGCAGNWVPEYLAEKYNFAIIMPSGENSFWLDQQATGHKFCTFVGEELIGYVRKTFGLALRAEDTNVMGFSMGGFGALHTGFAYPETFGKIGALSSAMLIHGIAHMKPGTDNGIANYEYYRDQFGDLETVEESDANPEVLVLRCLAEHKPIPGVQMCCGTEDRLNEGNRAMSRFLTEHQVAHEYWEAPGAHTMEFWQTHLVKMVEWMMA